MIQTLVSSRRLLHAAAGAALVLLGACGTTSSGTGITGPAPAPDIYQLYAMAVEDAAIYEASKLRPLNGAEVGPDGTVMVVTLGGDSLPPGEMTTEQNDFVWVTLVPEVRDSCDDWTDADKDMRLRQLLGLQPTSPVHFFAEMRVPASAMFRPTANPAITTDVLCDPVRDGPGCALVFPTGVDSAHFAFMVNQAFSAWKMPDGYPRERTDDWQNLGYPWTRLGYTFNWHPGSPRYGASEYVIKPGTRVTVTSSRSIANYCRAG
jgi:hypothetical protein